MSDYDDDDHYYDDDDDRSMFADPGGRSALRRAATSDKCPKCEKRIGWRDDYCKHCGRQLNSRKFPCPNCGAKNRLTREDVQLGYQCDRCADRAEGLYMGGDY